jgi:hypothetical protein
MARSGKSKSASYPNGKRRVNDNGDRLAPRAVRQKTDKHLMKNTNPGTVEKLSGIPATEQEERSTWG